MNTPRFVRVLALALCCLAPLAAQESAEVFSLRTKAQRGNAIAQYNLGLAYAKGRGIPQDNIEAFVWFSLAIENGARGKDLEALVGSLDNATLERARVALADRRSALGFPAPAAATPATTTSARAQPATRSGPAAPAPSGPATTGPAEAAPLTPAAPAGARQRPGGTEADTSTAGGPTETEQQLAGELARTRLQIEAIQRELAAEKASPTAEKFRRERDAVQARLAQVQADFTTLRSDRDRVQRLLTQVQTENKNPAIAAQLKSLEEKFSQTEDRAAELASRYDFARHELAAATTALNTRQQSGNDGAAALDAARKEVATLTARLQAETAGQAALVQQIDAARQTVAASNARLSELQAQAASNGGQAAKFQQELGTVRAEAVRLAEDRDTARREAAEAAARARELEARASGSQAETEKKLTAELRQLREEAVRLAEERDTARQQAGSLQQQLSSATTAADKAARDLAGNRDEIIRIAEEREAARQQAAQATARAQELEARVSSTQADSEKKLAATLGETRAEIVRVAEERDTLRTQTTALTSKVAQLERTNAELSARPAALSYPDLRGRVSDLEQQLASANQPKAPAYPDLRQRVATLETSLTAANAATEQAQNAASSQMRDLQSQLTAAKNAKPSYPDLRDRVAALEGDLATAQKSLSAKPAYPDLRGRVSELEKEASAKAASNRELASLRDQLTSAKTATEEARAELQQGQQRAETQIAALEKQLREKPVAPTYPDLRGQVASLEQQLTAARQGFDSALAAATKVEGLLTEVRTALNTAQEENVALVRQRDDARNSAAQTDRQLSSARTELEQTQRGLAAAEAARRQVSTERDNLAATAEDLRKQIAAAGQAPDRSGEIRSLGEQLTATRRERDEAIGAQQQTRQALATAEANWQKERDGLRQELAGAQTRHASATAQLEKLGKDAETRLAEAQFARNLAENTTRKTETQLTEVRDRLSAAEQQAQATANELATRAQRITALESQLQTASTAKPVAPAYPDLSSRVTELENAVAESLRRLATAESAKAEVEKQLAAAAEAKPAESPNVQLRRERDELTARVTDLAGEVSQLRGDRERMQRLLADAGKQLRDAQAGGNRARELEVALRQAKATADSSAEALAKAESRATQTAVAAETAANEGATLRARLDALTAENAGLSEKAGRFAEKTDELERRLAVASQPTAPAYPDLRGRVAELETAVRRAENRTPDYPDLRGRVAELETALQAAQARRLQPDEAKLRIAELEQQLAKSEANRRAQISAHDEVAGQIGNPAATPPTTPAYPDLRGRVAELEAAVRRAEGRTPDYPDLRGRVSELEQAVAQTDQRARSTASANGDLVRQLGETRAALQVASTPKTDPAVAELRRENATLNERLTQTTEEVGQLRSDRERMQRLLADTGQRLRDNSAEATRLKELESAVAAANNRAATADQARADVAKKLSDTEVLLEAARALPAGPTATQHTALQEQLKSTEERLTTALRGYSQLEKEVADLKAAPPVSAPAVVATTQPSAELNELQSQVASLTTELGRVRSESESARAELNRVTGTRSDAETRLAAVEQAAEQAASERDALRTELAAARQASAQLAQLQAQVSALQGRASEADRRVALAEGRATAAESDLVRLRQGIATLQGAPASTAQPVARPLSPPTAPPARTHTVAAGDTLSRISQRYYGNATRWPEIFNANAEQLRNASSLTVGMTLRIP